MKLNDKCQNSNVKTFLDPLDKSGVMLLAPKGRNMSAMGAAHRQRREQTPSHEVALYVLC